MHRDPSLSIDNAILYRLRVLRRLWRKKRLCVLPRPRLGSSCRCLACAAIACKSSLAVPINSAAINRNLATDDSDAEAFAKKAESSNRTHSCTKGGVQKKGRGTVNTLLRRCAGQLPLGNWVRIRAEQAVMPSIRGTAHIGAGFANPTFCRRYQCQPNTPVRLGSIFLFEGSL